MFEDQGSQPADPDVPDETGGGDVDKLGSQEINFVKEAAKLQYNWIALAGAAAFALISNSLLPLILAAGFELIYLSIVPSNPRFQRLVRSWKYAEQERRHQISLSALFDELPPTLRTRYVALESKCRAIRTNYSRLSSTSQIFVGQMEEKLQGLMQAYLRLLCASNQYTQARKNADPEEIKRDLAQLQRALDSDPPKVQDINRKRIQILTKRLEKLEKMCENTKVIDAQCAGIEDVLELIRDQSVTMRDPQQVSEQLGSLVHDVEQTEETVQQVEAIFALAAPEMGNASGDAVSDDTASSPTPRTRLRS